MGQKLGTVTSFKYIVAVVSHHGPKPEVLSRIAQATGAHTKRNLIWSDNNISLRSKVKPKHSLIFSIYSVCLCIEDLYGRVRERKAGL